MFDQIIIIAISILLIAIFLFIGDKLLGSGKPQLTAGYFLLAVITALLVIIVIIAAGAAVGFLATFLPGIGGIVPILGFVLATYIVKMVLVKEEFQRSMWITMIAYALVYITNAVAVYIGFQPIIQYI